MSEYVFLYRSEPADLSPAEGQQQMQRWVAWIKDLAAAGHMKDPGQPLEPREGQLVRGREHTVTDGPYAETKDLVCGFTVIEARDLAHASELARGCPILALGGLVEVRPVLRMNG